VSPVEYAGGKRPLRAYIAMCLQVHCNPSSFQDCADDIMTVYGRCPAYFNDVCASVGTVAGRARLD